MSMNREQLYSTICDIINKHALSELGFLPAKPEEADRTGNPYYPFLFVETNLGIPVSVVQHILAYATSEFMKYRQHNNQDLGKLELPSRILFMINPEHYSAANTRKALIKSKIVDAHTELRLIDLMFTIPRHSKSSIAWHHRKWIQRYLVSEPDYAIDFSREFQLCQRTATLYPKNYYSWTYRHWLLTQLPEASDLLKQEYMWSRAWVESHVSDHSGIQHLERCLLSSEELSTTVTQHMEWLRENIKRYPGHEALWCHLRFCAHLAQSRSLSPTNMERQFIEQCLQECTEPTDESEMQKQRQLALRYGLWISHLTKHSPVLDTELDTWSTLAQKTYTKELEILADQSTFYKLFAGWSCKSRKYSLHMLKPFPSCDAEDETESKAPN